MNVRVQTYHRLIQSEKAEQILQNSKIFLDTNTLRPHFIGKDQSKSGELYRYMKSASQNGGYISTEYHSKDIITARMFVCKSHLNIINLSDERILSAMRSRYTNGIILCLDFKAFEPSIIRHTLGDIFPNDLHTWASELLKLDRQELKRTNMALLYCEDFTKLAFTIVDELSDKGCRGEDIFEYIDRLSEIRVKINEFVDPHLTTYESKGYVVNSYGRKIYPKESRNIFSNIIQSVGSEILVESIINLNTFLAQKEIHLLFHRFDALYFDVSRKELLKSASQLRKVMESSGGDIQLEVGVQLGESMASLKDIESG